MSRFLRPTLIALLISFSGLSFATSAYQCESADSTNDDYLTCYRYNGDATDVRIKNLQTKLDEWRLVDQSTDAATPNETQINEIKDLLQSAKEALTGGSADLYMSEPSDIRPLPTRDLARIMADILIEPLHMMSFKNLLDGKKFYEGITTAPDLPDRARINQLTQAVGSNIWCDPLKTNNQCLPGNLCVEFDQNQSAGQNACLTAGNSCNNGSECCSGACNLNVCEEFYKCSNCMPEDTSFDDGTVNCCGSLTKAQYTDSDDGSTYYKCHDLSYVGAANIPLGFSMDPNTCSPQINQAALKRFELNERVLLAFEYVFGTAATYDYYGQLSAMKGAANIFKTKRVDTKKAYMEKLNGILQNYEDIATQNIGIADLGTSTVPSGVDEYLAFEFFIQENQAMLERDKARGEAYAAIKDPLDAVAEGIRSFKWKKKKWFKKNKCGEWSIPFLKGKNHKKCSKLIWNMGGGATNSNMEEYLRQIEKPTAFPGSCIMDPAYPAGSGIGPASISGKKNISNPGSIDSVFEKIKTDLAAYAAQPIGVVSTTQTLTLPDALINLQTDRRHENGLGGYTSEDVDLLGDLAGVATRTVAGWGVGASCENPGQSKFNYIEAIKDVVQEVQAFYLQSAALRETAVIPCLTAKRDAFLASPSCDPSVDSNCDPDPTACVPGTNDPSCGDGSDGVCADPTDTNDPDCAGLDGICADPADTTDPDCTTGNGGGSGGGSSGSGTSTSGTGLSSDGSSSGTSSGSSPQLSSLSQGSAQSAEEEAEAEQEVTDVTGAATQGEVFGNNTQSRNNGSFGGLGANFLNPNGGVDPNSTEGQLIQAAAEAAAAQSDVGNTIFQNMSNGYIRVVYPIIYIRKPAGQGSNDAANPPNSGL